MKTFIPSASLKRIQSPEGSGGIGTYSSISIQDIVLLPNRTLAVILTFAAHVWKLADLNSADAGSSLYQLCAYWSVNASKGRRSCRIRVDAWHDAKGSTTDLGLLETSEDSGRLRFLGSSFLKPKQSPLCAWLSTDSITGNQPQGHLGTLFAKSITKAFVVGSI